MTPGAATKHSRRRKTIWKRPASTWSGIKNALTQETSVKMWSSRNQLHSGQASIRNTRIWLRERSACRVLSTRSTFCKWARKTTITCGSWNWGNQKYQHGISSLNGIRSAACNWFWVMTLMFTRVLAMTCCSCWEKSAASLSSYWSSVCCSSAGSISLTPILSWCQSCTLSRLMSSNRLGASSKLVRCTITQKRRATPSRNTSGRRWGIIWSWISRAGYQFSDPVFLDL